MLRVLALSFVIPVLRKEEKSTTKAPVLAVRRLLVALPLLKNGVTDAAEERLAVPRGTRRWRVPKLLPAP